MKKGLFFVLLLFCVSIAAYIIFDYQHNKAEQLKKKEQQDLVNNITEHYNQYVKNKKTASLYSYNDKQRLSKNRSKLVMMLIRIEFK